MYVPGVVVCFGNLVYLAIKGGVRLDEGAPSNDVQDQYIAGHNVWFWCFWGYSMVITMMQGYCWSQTFQEEVRISKMWACSTEEEMQSLLDESEKKKKKRQKSVADVGKLVRMMHPERYLLMGAGICLILASASQVFVPHFLGKVVDYVAIEDDYAKFKQSLLLLVVVAFTQALFSGLRGALFTLCTARLQVRVRENLYESLLRQDIGFFDQSKTGDIVSRLTTDTSKMCDLITFNANVFLRSMFSAGGILIFMFYINWKLTLVTFTAVPVVVVVSKVFGNYYRGLSKLVQEQLAKANAVAQEVIGTMKTVRSFANEKGEHARFCDELKGIYELQLRQSKIYVAFLTTVSVLPNLVMVLVLYYGGHLVMDGEMSGGELVSFLLYQMSLSENFNAMGAVFTGLMQAVGAADQVFEMMEREPEISPPGALVPKTFSGKVELKHVNFHYPSRANVQVMDDFTLAVSPGEVVALVGPSGGGKTSTINLLERFYTPTSGQVLVDDRDIGEYDPEFLHRQMTLVGQEPVLYGSTVRENIAYGLQESEYTYDDIVEAAKLANAHTFISAMPDAYDTQVGERGVTLSGGQKQRIAIARALVRRPKILLLDEATSALDAESESLVQAAIDNMMQGRTVIVIAHRLSTVKNADRIVVVKHGSIQEEGSHAELIQAKGVYYNLVQKQLQTMELGADSPAPPKADSPAADSPAPPPKTDSLAPPPRAVPLDAVAAVPKLPLLVDASDSIAESPTPAAPAPEGSSPKGSSPKGSSPKGSSPKGSSPKGS
eukprot:Rmarinus@m.2337